MSNRTSPGICHACKFHITLKPGLHIVVRVAEHACDDASKRILKLSTYLLQTFLVRDQYLQSLLPYRDQAIAAQLKKHVLKPMFAILMTHIETRLKSTDIQQYTTSQNKRERWLGAPPTHNF